ADLPADVLTEVLDAFDPGALTVEATHHPDGTVWFDCPERTVGQARQAAEAVLAVLRAHDLDVPFSVAEDPKFEWLGTLCRYHPDLGMHEADCDANGQAVLTDATYSALAATARTPDALLGGIREDLGLDWASVPI